MRFTRAFLCLALILIPAVAGAVPPDMILEFGNSPMGKVIFDGAIHQQAGFACQDCHNDWLFPQMKQGTVKMTMDDIRAGRWCGACHDGIRAFAPEGNCKRCHIAP